MVDAEEDEFYRSIGGRENEQVVSVHADDRADHVRDNPLPKQKRRPKGPIIELDDGFWTNAVVMPPVDGKRSIHLRVDADVLDWFKARGKGHLTRMNAVLRAYMEAETAREGAPKAAAE